MLGAAIEKMEEMILLNVNALTRLTYAAVPGFVAQRGGTIINIASMAAIKPGAQNGVYEASKVFVLAFSQSLRHELEDKQVNTQVVLHRCHRDGLLEIGGNASAAPSDSNRDEHR